MDFEDYTPESNRGYRYVLVVTDNFSKFGWTDALRNKNAQTIKDSFENINIISKRSPNLIESDRGKEVHKNSFQNFLNHKNIKLCSRNNALGVVYAQKFNRAFRDLLKRPAFEKGECNWIDILTT